MIAWQTTQTSEARNYPWLGQDDGMTNRKTPGLEGLGERKVTDQDAGTGDRVCRQGARRGGTGGGVLRG